MRKLVVPGDLIAEDENARASPLMFKENSKVYASVLGLVEMEEELHKKGPRIKIIPLAGKYIPKVGDFVIGVVTAVQGSLWLVDIFSPYKAALSEKDSTGERRVREFDRRERRESEDSEEMKRKLPSGSVIYAKIREISVYKKVFLTLGETPAKVLKEGHVIMVSPVKVPRIIGKKNSMVNMMQEETGCSIVVGQNGAVWMNGSEEDIELAVSAIREVERRSHVQGLTEKIKNMISEMRKRKWRRKLRS